ncbi:MAG: hypothetical protein ACI4I0_05950 [Acutalibacteraceae bacterium]
MSKHKNNIKRSKAKIKPTAQPNPDENLQNASPAPIGDAKTSSEVSIKRESIAKTIFYGVTVSILASALLTLCGSTSGFRWSDGASSVILGVSAFCFYTGYFFDDVVYGDSEPLKCLPWTVLGWAFFMIQAVSIANPSTSVVFAVLGLISISVGIARNKGRNFWQEPWIVQNTVAILLLVCYLFSHFGHISPCVAIDIALAKVKLFRRFICNNLREFIPLLMLAAGAMILLSRKLIFERGLKAANAEDNLEHMDPKPDCSRPKGDPSSKKGWFGNMNKKKFVWNIFLIIMLILISVCVFKPKDYATSILTSIFTIAVASLLHQIARKDLPPNSFVQVDNVDKKGEDKIISMTGKSAH